MVRLIFLVFLCTGHALAEDRNDEVPPTFSSMGEDTKTTNGSLGIVGGTDAQCGDVPWQVSFQAWGSRGWRHICGGSIIAPDRIATAAHCCDGQENKYLRIIAGAVNKAVHEPTQQRIRVSRVVMHPQYNQPTRLNNDACKLYLSSSLTFDHAVQSIPLCTQSPDSGTCLISGWGAIDQAGRRSTDKLQKLYLQIMPRAECSRRKRITDAMLCVGGQTEGEGGCFGDSGGPAACYTSSGRCLAGATSHGGYPCAQRGNPTVYADVANLYDFFSS